MTKKLEETLGLPSIDEMNLNEENSDKLKKAYEDLEVVQLEYENLQKKDSDISWTVIEKSYSELRDEALRSYRDLMDAGMNVPSKDASQFIEPAIRSLELATDIERQRVDRALKHAKLKLDERKTEQADDKLKLEREKFEWIKKRDGLEADDTNTEGISLKTHELLEAIEKRKKENSQ